MTNVLVEQQLGDIPWLVLQGNRRLAFQALGSYSAQLIQDVLDGLPEAPNLRTRTKTSWGARQLETICRTSRKSYPEVWLELESLAKGAALGIEDLLLLSLRGDLGTDGSGCSDVGWTNGTRALMGHNEDGDWVLDGRCFLLTLRLEDEPSLSTWWYPGFLPGNTFSVNERGLVFALDSLYVPKPRAAPGRCFVARSLQKQVNSASALRLLYDHPSAGGFAYNLGQAGSAELTMVEAAAGHYVCRSVSEGPRISWHTNHARLLPSGLTSSSDDGLSRARFLRNLEAPSDPRASWLADVLASGPPEGVQARDAESVTLCTLAVDLETSECVLLANGARPVSLALLDLARGDASTTLILEEDWRSARSGEAKA